MRSCSARERVALRSQSVARGRSRTRKWLIPSASLALLAFFRDARDDRTELVGRRLRVVNFAGVYYSRDLAFDRPAPARRGASADPSRSLVTARVVSARPPSAASASGDDADADGRYSGEPILFRFGDDGEPVAAETSLAFDDAASERERWNHVDDAGAESAVKCSAAPDGNLLFRFTGDAREEFEAAAAQADQPRIAVTATRLRR